MFPRRIPVKGALSCWHVMPIPLMEEEHQALLREELRSFEATDSGFKRNKGFPKLRVPFWGSMVGPILGSP